MSRHIARIANVTAVTIVLVAGIAKGGPPGTAPGQRAPTNLVPPSISGVPAVGGVLTADPQQWDGKGVKFAYQWMRCDSTGGACSTVENASSATYTIAPAPLGTTLRVVVTASNKNGSAAATSAATDVVAEASPTPPPRSPDPVAPSNTTPPTISGLARVGQILTASPGSWSGASPLEYGYQWKRCDSAGTSCGAIANATQTTYSVSSNDVSSRISVSVTTTNSAGSATASSEATLVVTVAEPSESTPTASPYFVDEFDGSLPGTWLLHPSGAVPSLADSVSDESGGKAARLICTPTSSGPNSSSELTSMFLGNGDSRIHTGRGEETWYRIRMRFPSGAYFPTTGQWNWHVEWHNDDRTASYGSVSTGLGVYTDYPVVSGDVGKNPRLALRLVGGLSSSPQSESHELPLGSLRYDHWYDIVFRIVWGTDTDGTGWIAWWVDGTRWLSKSFPMLQRNPDGTVDRPAFGLYNYRLHDPTHTSEVRFGSVLIGPSAASVGFTP